MNRLAEAWNRYLFDPESTASLAVMRIVFGLIVVGWTLALAPDIDAFFTSTGVLPAHPEGRWTLSVLEYVTADAFPWVLWGVLLLAGVCLTLGLFSRLASVVVWIALLSLERRNPYVFNSGDLLMRHVAFFLMLAPTGVALSLDRRRHGEPAWGFPERPPWPLRLLQLQLSIGYLMSVWAKVRGTTWNNGTATGFALRLEDLTRFAPPAWVSDNEMLVNLATYGTLVVEGSLAVLVWNRTLRPYVLLAGVALHLGIDITIQVGFFSYTLFAAYLAWVPPDQTERALERMRAWLRQRRAPAPASAAASEGTTG